MNLIIQTPLGITSQGIRSQNEDAIFPTIENSGKESRIFVVCDGVGGSQKGDMASRMAAAYWGQSLEMKGFFPYEDEFYQTLLKRLKEDFKATEEKYPACAGMGTTMVFINLQQDGIHAGWIGDSRLVQFRDGRIHWRSIDHSYVMQLVAAREITEDEAAHHPQKNIILRSISTSDMLSQIDTLLISDVKPGDRFLLCTDGITDMMEWDFLEKIFSGNTSIQQCYDYLLRYAQEFSRDNYSMYLIEIAQNPEDKKNIVYDELVASSPVRNKWLWIILALLSLGSVASFFVVKQLRINKRTLAYSTALVRADQRMKEGDLYSALSGYYDVLKIIPDDSIANAKITEIRTFLEEIEKTKMRDAELERIADSLQNELSDKSMPMASDTVQDTNESNAD